MISVRYPTFRRELIKGNPDPTMKADLEVSYPCSHSQRLQFRERTDRAGRTTEARSGCICAHGASGRGRISLREKEKYYPLTHHAGQHDLT